MDNNRQVKPVSAEALKMLFTTLKDNIRVVVLNACYSEIQAQAIAEVIDCVVGMSTAIGDDAAIIFAASFYRAIGFGRSIKEAFDQGKTAIMLEGIPEANTPQLLTRMGVDASSLTLLKGDQGETPAADSLVNLPAGTVIFTAENINPSELGYAGIWKPYNGSDKSETKSIQPLGERKKPE